MSDTGSLIRDSLSPWMVLGNMFYAVFFFAILAFMFKEARTHREIIPIVGGILILGIAGFLIPNVVAAFLFILLAGCFGWVIYVAFIKKGADI